MGTGLLAKCACGFETETAVGGTRRTYRMRNYPIVCLFPCFCKECKDMVTVDLCAKPPSCPACGSTAIVPYDQPELIGTLGTLTKASCAMQYELGRDLVLTDGLYRCPKCNRMSLRFVATTLFD
jgi:hypothetical protein